jgi:hypothetical protein
MLTRRFAFLALCFLGACDTASPPPDAAATDDAFGPDAPLLEDAFAPLADAPQALDAPVEDAPRDAFMRTSSGGSGGLPCTRMGTVSGVPYCVAQVGSVEMKIVEPTASTGPMRLAVYLHGDGARAYTGDTVVRLQAPWARGANVLYVAALAPNRCAWWLRPSLPACDGAITAADRDDAGENAAALLAAIEALRAGWDIREDVTYLGGSSGGSVFLQGSFLPRYGDRIRGVVALGCGGDAPWAPFAWSVTPTSIGPTALFSNYGDADMLVPDIERGTAAYEALGFPVATNVLPGVGHCMFDHIGWVRDTWQAH